LGVDVPRRVEVGARAVERPCGIAPDWPFGEWPADVPEAQQRKHQQRCAPHGAHGIVHRDHTVNWAWN
jgi:hypothetical protein